MNNPLNQRVLTKALAYVRKNLLENGGEFPPYAPQSFRRRSRHIERVLLWCKRLLKNETGLSADTALTVFAALFHDVGYNNRGIPHEELGADIFLRFAEENGFPDTLTRRTADIIRRHSHKEELSRPETAVEQVLVMEADLLDEEGILGIAIDCMTCARLNPDMDDYTILPQYLRRYAGEILSFSPMVTPYAASCWRKKQDAVRLFLQAMEEDLFLPSSGYLEDDAEYR